MTLKVMLADDELLVRLGIKSLIEWDKHGFSFIGDAPDGIKALELMEEEVPDILLTDIIMPRMDGLELIETAKKRYPDMLFIVLSSHNQFDYVRKAMKMGVEDYILKTSLKPTELLQILTEASQKIEKNREYTLSDTSASEQRYSRKELLSSKVREGLQTPFPAGGGVNWQEEEELPPGSFMLIMQPRLLREGVEELSAMRMLTHLFQSELGEQLVCSPIEMEGREIVLLVAERDPAVVTELLIGASSRMLGIALNVGVSGSIEAWQDIGFAYNQAKDMLNENRIKETAREDIKRLLEFMKENYAKDISLKIAADIINMSESYLSFIFKKETGTVFTDYLNNLRVDKAAHYLMNSQMPIYEIAMEVGYENINYFGRIFKKLKGVSPQKYRAQYK